MKVYLFNFKTGRIQGGKWLQIPIFAVKIAAKIYKIDPRMLHNAPF